MKITITYLSEIPDGEIYRFNKKWYKKTLIGSMPYDLKGDYQGIRIEYLEKHKSDEYVAIMDSKSKEEEEEENKFLLEMKLKNE